jgi:hypothetical protein
MVDHVNQKTNPPFDLKYLTPRKIMDHIDGIISGDNDISEEINSRMVDASEDSVINHLFERGGYGCISRGDIIVIKGKPKNGKTMFLTGLIVAAVQGEHIGFKAKQRGLTIIYADTEQNRANTAMIRRRVQGYCMNNFSDIKLIFLNFRSDSPSERRRIILEAVKLFKPDLLIIDGAKDLIDSLDVNDARKCGEVIQFLMSLSQENNLALVTTLHENKGDTNPRGHLGSELLNKSSECWQVRKATGGIFNVEQTETRNHPVPGLNFQLNKDVIPVLIDIPSKFPMTEEKRENKFREAFQKCLPEGVRLKYSELRSKYASETKCPEKSAENHIKKAVKEGIIKKDDEDGKYAFNYQK